MFGTLPASRWIVLTSSVLRKKKQISLKTTDDKAQVATKYEISMIVLPVLRYKQLPTIFLKAIIKSQFNRLFQVVTSSFFSNSGRPRM